MVSRIYVEKKPGFDVEAQQLAHELRSILGITSLEGLRLVNRYDVEGISQELFDQCVPTVFSEPQVDVASTELPQADGAQVFAVEFLPGQFDQRAASAKRRRTSRHGQAGRQPVSAQQDGKQTGARAVPACILGRKRGRAVALVPPDRGWLAICTYD